MLCKVCFISVGTEVLAASSGDDSRYCGQPFVYFQGPASQTCLPYVCPFHPWDNQ